MKVRTIRAVTGRPVQINAFFQTVTMINMLRGMSTLESEKEEEKKVKKEQRYNLTIQSM